MILCDIDGVLAIGPTGDTRPGEPIYRTSQRLEAELREVVAAAGIPFHVVTAKVESEARQVLRAVGAEAFVDSLISADRLFWPSVWQAVRQGRWPASMSKSGCLRLLPEGSGSRVVMLENHAPHLQELLDLGIIDFGVLVPPVGLANGRLIRWFDLGLALRVARDLSVEGAASEDLASRGISALCWRRSGPKELPDEVLPARFDRGGYLLQLPTLSADAGREAPLLEALYTGRSFRAGRRNVVTTVRTGRRLARQLVARLFARSG